MHGVGAGCELDLGGVARTKTGVPGLDEILGGGFVRGHSYLLVGKAGTGKTMVSLQWLREGLARGEQVLYVTLAERWSEMVANAATLGWDISHMEHLDLAPKGAELPDEYHVFAPSEVEKEPVWRLLMEGITKARPVRLVIDSLTQLRYLTTDDHQFRRQTAALVNALNARECTSLLLFEPDELARGAAPALSVNGVLHLGSTISPGAAIGLRSVQVEKMRGSGFMTGTHPMRLGGSGAVVFPHRIEHPVAAEPVPGAHDVLATGVPGLDELLEGGIESATTTLLSGPAGTGKTTLATHFAVRHADALGAAIFTFEEEVDLLCARATRTGAPLEAARASGRLTVQRVNPLELFPDEFLALVRRAVEVEGRRLVVVDSLRAYGFAMEEFGRAQAHIHNLVAYLTRLRATVILVSEVEAIGGPNLVATEMGVSHLADNIVLMRYAEDAGRVMKVIGCLKKRGGGFEPGLREFSIARGGLRVGPPLDNLRNGLSGTPHTAPAR